MEALYDKLKEKVEKVAGRAMMTPRDFDYLSSRIFDATRSYVASTTLKRFWGYIEAGKVKRPLRNTLNVLAQYAGYADWECFAQSFDSEVQSDFLHM